MITKRPTLQEWLNQHYLPQGGYTKFEELLKAGATQRHISGVFGVTEKQIRIWVKKYRGLR